MKKPFDIQQFIRPNVLSMKPYASARDEFKDHQADLVFLDANENPYDTGYNRYPDPQQIDLKSRIAAIKNVPVNHVFLGNGSDEVLDLIFRAFCEPQKDEVMILPPTYGMYEVLANLNAIHILKVDLDTDFQPNVDAILKQQSSSTKILFLCAPNNPTGNSIDEDKIEALLHGFNGLVVIDEAYIDFTTKDSWSVRLQEFPNLIITQTLSKAYGLAGIRLGICYASEAIIRILNRIKPPYNVNMLTQEKALEDLKQTAIIDEKITKIIAQRRWLVSELENICFIEKVFPSEANFLLVKVDNADKRYEQLINKGIVVRNRTNQPNCYNCLRFTIGTPMDNIKLLSALKQIS
ncbi:histidinol-phosphate transaminase [Psychroserpens sp. BH13MA-6]